MPESCADLKCPNSHLAIAWKKPRCGQDLVIARINELRKVSLHGACSFDRMGVDCLVTSWVRDLITVCGSIGASRSRCQ